MPRIVLYLLPLVLTIYALVDVARTEDERVGGIPRLVWFIVVALVQPAIGAIVWLVVTKAMPRIQAERDSRDRSGSPAGASLGALVGFQRRHEDEAPAQLAPDDDPEFLFRLKAEELRRRRAAQDAAKKEQARRDLLRPRGQAGTDDAAAGPTHQDPAASGGHNEAGAPDDQDGQGGADKS
ncbi:PLDc N-terminal domain-containing protein [Buchananella felis]|uniref:PLDc N-terminal domain-containing protein n=1 Tax=Buchananella felis TaxID=3231492 RepID=UPI003529326C